MWLIFREGRVALRRRPDSGLLARLWEYPNVEGESREPPPEWGITAGRAEFGGTARHIFTHIEWHMTARLVQAEEDTLPDGWVWAAREELVGDYAIPSAFDGLSHLVERGLAGTGGADHDL